MSEFREASLFLLVIASKDLIELKSLSRFSLFLSGAGIGSHLFLSVIQAR